jgi:serine/threonine protein kinase
MASVALADYVFDMANYGSEKLCGSGAFSSVFLYTNMTDGRKIAVKRMDKDIERPDKQTMFFREITILLALRHPAVLPFRGFNLPSQDHRCFEIVTEYMANGNVQTHLDREAEGRPSPRWDATCKMKVIFGVACGMAHVHKSRIMHRDLKSENIFLDDLWEPRIADFGLSKTIEQDTPMMMSAVVGTPYYMAPELFACDDTEPASYPIDVYAYAVIVLSLFVGGRFKFDRGQIRNMQVLVAGLASGQRFVIPPAMPDWCRELITQCWAQNPAQRWTFDQAVRYLVDHDYALEKTDLAVYRSYRTKLLEFGEGPAASDRPAPVVKETQPYDFS